MTAIMAMESHHGAFGIINMSVAYSQHSHHILISCDKYEMKTRMDRPYHKIRVLCV